VWLTGIAFSIVLLLVPRLVRRPREGTLAPSVVDPRLCTGCNQCPQDCPWEAITMVPRKDDRPTLVAFVNEARCVSCGICAGSCAPMGVGPPGRTGRDQLDVLRHLLPTLGADAPGGRMPVVAVVCNECPGSHIDAFRQRGLHVHPVSCAGNLHSSVVEWFIRRGSPGVIVGSCPPRDCVNREGPKWLHERLFNDREAELQDRVDHRRVRTTVLAPGMLGDTLADVDEFLRSVALLDRPVAADGEVVPLCEPVPIEEAIT